jgi:hypothetical protein
MINKSKRIKILEFFNWVDELSLESDYEVVLEEGAKKHLKQQITNPINMKRIKKNIEYIINDPQNIKKKAPNDWHKLTYFKKDGKMVYTMDINGSDRMAYYIKDNVIIFSMIGHL